MSLLVAQHEAAADVLRAVERAPAIATVGSLGVDAIWIAPTEQGALTRASLCLWQGMAPALVCDALARWSWSS